MVDASMLTAEPPAPFAPTQPSVVVQDVHITYRVYEDKRPTLRRFVANGLRPRSYRPIYAVRGISLAAYPGEAIGVIGRNGFGKSTLMRAIAGLVPPTQGRVLARSVPVLLGVGAVLVPGLSGRRNIYIGTAALGLTRRETDAAFDEIVDFAGLRFAIDRPMRMYSSGMKSRLQFAIASIVTPEVLLIDEALSVGDAEFRKKSRQRVKQMLGEAGTVFIVTHQEATLRKMCDRAFWLDDGVVVLEGDADDVADAYAAETQADGDA